MKNTFLVSALSLAIAASINVQAETAQSSEGPEACVVEGGKGESLKEWGIWCGVGSFLAALSEMEPSAAGPGGEGPEIDFSGPGGRGESDAFDPAGDVEPSTPAHVVLPVQGEGQFVGYFAAVDRSGNYGADFEGGYGDPTNHEVGGFTLAVEDGYSGGYGDFFGESVGYGDGVDTIVYGRYNADGSPKDGDSYSSEDNYSYYDEVNGYEESRTEVDITEEEYPSRAYHYDHSSQNDGENYEYYGDHFYANEVTVYNSGGEDGPQPLRFDLREGEILKNYWAGSHFQYQRNGDEYDEQVVVFVAGVLTPLSDLQNLISGDVSAVYTGNSMRLYQSVRLDVDFGGQTFTGEFGDGDPYSKQYSGIDMNTDISFTAEGVIDGANLISTSVSADSGFVQGSFYGDQGRIVGGAYDVTIGADRVVDAFTAVEGEGNRVSGNGPS